MLFTSGSMFSHKKAHKSQRKIIFCDLCAFSWLMRAASEAEHEFRREPGNRLRVQPPL